MARCFSFTAQRDSCYRASFRKKGLRSTTTDLGDGTVVHCWIPSSHSLSKPTLLCIHGFGANTMWQFGPLLSRLIPAFNLYLPDLVFFGDSYTSRSDRSTSFQAHCVFSVLSSLLPDSDMTVDVVGISYGGFVAYRLAEIFPRRVRRVVLACAGVCLEESDIAEGMFHVKSVEEAVEILLPLSPQKVRELTRLAFHKPPPPAPSCFLNDFIEVMCVAYRQEKKELIYEIYKEKKETNLPRISQPALILWGDDDKIFPVELGHRLIRHLGDNARLIILKKTGHYLSAEKPKELIYHLKQFLLDENPLPSSNALSKKD